MTNVARGEHVIATAVLKDKVNYEWSGEENPTEDYEIVFEIFKTNVEYFTINGEKVENNSATFNLSDIADGLTFNAVIHSNLEEPVDIACSGFDNATFTINQDSTTAKCEMNGKTLMVSSAGTITLSISVPETENCADKNVTLTITIV